MTRYSYLFNNINSLFIGSRLSVLKHERENRRADSDIEHGGGQVHGHAHERHSGLPRFLLRGGIPFRSRGRRVERARMFDETRGATIARHQRRDLPQEPATASDSRRGCGGGDPDEHGGSHGDTVRE